MRLKGYILPLLVAIAFVSCAGKKSVPSTASIHFQRTACFGACPIYTLTINGEGLAEFHGERFTDKIGRYQKQLSREDTKALFELLNSADWTTFEDEYPTKVTDLPGILFKYNYKKVSKQIVIYGEHPEQLDVFSEYLSKIAESDGWTNLNID
jgi:hypothetical protein